MMAAVQFQLFPSANENKRLTKTKTMLQYDAIFQISLEYDLLVNRANMQYGYDDVLMNHSKLKIKLRAIRAHTSLSTNFNLYSALLSVQERCLRTLVSVSSRLVYFTYS